MLASGAGVCALAVSTFRSFPGSPFRHVKVVAREAVHDVALAVEHHCCARRVLLVAGPYCDPPVAAGTTAGVGVAAGATTRMASRGKLKVPPASSITFTWQI